MRVSALSDQELIRLYVQGDEICFEELVNRHKDRTIHLLSPSVEGSQSCPGFFPRHLSKGDQYA